MANLCYLAPISRNYMLFSEQMGQFPYFTATTFSNVTVTAIHPIRLSVKTLHS